MVVDEIVEENFQKLLGSGFRDGSITELTSMSCDRRAVRIKYNTNTGQIMSDSQGKLSNGELSEISCIQTKNGYHTQNGHTTRIYKNELIDESFPTTHGDDILNLTLLNFSKYIKKNKHQYRF